jgi:hypothetical protein
LFCLNSLNWKSFLLLHESTVNMLQTLSFASFSASVEALFPADMSFLEVKKISTPCVCVRDTPVLHDVIIILILFLCVCDRRGTLSRSAASGTSPYYCPLCP